MTQSPTLASLVMALFDLARLGLAADPRTLAGRLGVDPDRAVRGLVQLERLGLAHASRARLSLAGLALAAHLDAERSSRVALRIDGASANDAPLGVCAA